jgi:hypothetical protein
MLLQRAGLPLELPSGAKRRGERNPKLGKRQPLVGVEGPRRRIEIRGLQHRGKPVQVRSRPRQPALQAQRILRTPESSNILRAHPLATQLLGEITRKMTLVCRDERTLLATHSPHLVREIDGGLTSLENGFHIAIECFPSGASLGQLPERSREQQVKCATLLVEQQFADLLERFVERRQQTTVGGTLQCTGASDRRPGIANPSLPFAQPSSNARRDCERVAEHAISEAWRLGGLARVDPLHCENGDVRCGSFIASAEPVFRDSRHNVHGAPPVRRRRG